MSRLAVAPPLAPTHAPIAGRLERLALASSLVTLGLVASMERPVFYASASASFSPEDLKAWAAAIAAATASICTAINLALVVGRRLRSLLDWIGDPDRRKPRKRKRKAHHDAPDPKPGPPAPA